MATIKITKIEQLKYRDGYDVSAEMCADDGRKGNITFFIPGKDKPTPESLSAKLSKFITDFNMSPEPEQKTYLQSEIDEILVQKKYFQSGQKFPDDLPVKTLKGK